jgi:hypothetical protein
MEKTAAKVVAIIRCWLSNQPTNERINNCFEILLHNVWWWWRVLYDFSFFSSKGGGLTRLVTTTIAKRWHLITIERASFFFSFLSFYGMDGPRGEKRKNEGNNNTTATFKTDFYFIFFFYF